MRRIIAVTVAASALIALAACGKAPEKTAEPAPAVTAFAETPETSETDESPEAVETSAVDVQVEVPAWEGRWEYTFNFRGDTILVQSKHPDQIYKRV